MLELFCVDNILLLFSLQNQWKMNFVRSWLLETSKQSMKRLGLTLQRNITFALDAKDIVLPGRNFIYENKKVKDVLTIGTSLRNHVFGYHSERREPDASPSIRDAHPVTPAHNIGLSNKSQRVKQRVCINDPPEVSETDRRNRAHHTYIGFPTKSNCNTTLGPSDEESSDITFLQLPQVKNKDGLVANSSNNITTVENVVVSERDDDWTREMKWVVDHETRNVLTLPMDKEVDVLAPQLRPTFNLAAYVNK